MEAFLIDWGVADQGHMKNMLQPDATQAPLTDVGIGITKTSNAGLGPKVVTVDFGRHTASQPQLLGVAYNQDADGYYEAGEGQGNVEVDAVRLQDGQPTGPTHSVQTWDASGAYQMPLDPGPLPGHRLVRRTRSSAPSRSTIEGQNVKVDYRLNDPWQATAPVVTPAAAPAVAPAVITAATPAATTPPPAATAPVPTPAVTTPSVVPATAPTPPQPTAPATITAAVPANATIPSGWSVSYTYGSVVNNWVEYSN